jgi:2-polyprenyl-3-methyl-5-hydroxy-6-metoxy-1,4-benzoquinol methylase
LSEHARLPACPACGGERFRRLFTKKGRDFWRCPTCGLARQHPLPTEREQRAYYDASHETGMYRAFVEAERIKQLTAGARLRQIRGRVRPGRWLDVGCSNGTFVAEAARAGMAAEGVDLSLPAVEQARRRGLTAWCGTLEQLEPGYRYDTVTGFDVLEHVIDPTAFIAAVRRLLVPGGSVALSFPNEAGWIRRVMGQRWFFYIPEEHLHYFGPASIRRFLGRNGFRVRSVAPTFKTLTWTYSQLQFAEYNPLLHRLLAQVERALPLAVRELPVPLYIGELLVVAERVE